MVVVAVSRLAMVIDARGVCLQAVPAELLPGSLALGSHGVHEVLGDG